MGDTSSDYGMLFDDLGDANAPAWSDTSEISDIVDINGLSQALAEGTITEDQARSALGQKSNIAARKTSMLKGRGRAGSQALKPLLYGEIDPYVFSFQNHMCIEYPIKFYSETHGQTRDTGRVVLPVAPETFEVSGTNQLEEFTSIAGQTFTHAGPLALRTITLEGMFPYVKSREHWPDYIPRWMWNEHVFYQPSVLRSKFTTAMRASQPIWFSVYKRGNERPIFAIPVVVSDFSWSIKHANGEDAFWNMTLREWAPQYMLLGSVVNGTGIKGTQRPIGGCAQANHTSQGPVNNAHGPVTRKTYTIKKGDTLKKIADKTMGSAALWEALWKYNLDILNKALKKHGKKPNNPKILYPGTVIRIPPKNNKLAR